MSVLLQKDLKHVLFTFEYVILITKANNNNLKFFTVFTLYNTNKRLCFLILHITFQYIECIRGMVSPKYCFIFILM